MTTEPTAQAMTTDPKAAHTPGPWVIGEQNGHGGLSIERVSKDERIATVYLGLVTSAAKWGAEHLALPENREAIANARLIAAAPELLEAARLGAAYDELLRRYAGPLDVLCDGDVAEIDAAYDAWVAATRAAIAKAQGEA